jgi:hypothetical protein
MDEVHKMKLDKKVKHKWLKALRSGKYEQGQFYLKRNDRFCCLGVLCDTVKPNKWEKSEGIGRPELHELGGGGVSTLSKDFMKKINLPISALNKLITMNDVQVKSFEEIASYISRNL